jgi:hypothetical protein
LLQTVISKGDTQMTKYFTNPRGIRFYVEEARDFDETGRNIKGRGFFAGLVQGNCDLGGVWFPTYEAAFSAGMNYGG